MADTVWFCRLCSVGELGWRIPRKENTFYKQRTGLVLLASFLLRSPHDLPERLWQPVVYRLPCEDIWTFAKKSWLTLTPSD